MPKYMIERDLGGSVTLPPEELKAMSKRSIEAAKMVDPTVHWLESFITNDKIYCVFIAENDKAIQEHAKHGKFPCTKISKVYTKLDRTSAE
jgi:hypothetical protein